MELNYIETAEQAKSLLDESNFWTDSGNDALFFFVDANFAILLPILCFKVNLYTLSLTAAAFILLAVLKKRDMTLFEMVTRVRLLATGQKYRRRK